MRDAFTSLYINTVFSFDIRLKVVFCFLVRFVEIIHLLPAISR